MQLNLLYLLSLNLAPCLGIPLQQRANGFICPLEDIEKTKCLGPKDCLYPNPESCITFIQCTVNPDNTGTPVVMPCPANLMWNDNRKYCDWPSQTTCKNEEEVIKDTIEELVPPAGTEQDSSFSCVEALSSQGCMDDEPGTDCVYARPGSCNSFIRCVDEVAYVIQCEPNTVYDDEIKSCKLPSEDETCA